MIGHFFLVAFLPQLPGVLYAVNTARDWTVFAGDSITVPCEYQAEYTPNVKYWCQGSLQNFCTILARTDELNTGSSSEGRVTITDDPTQQVFTVTMRELMEKDSGWYWCGVESGGIWSKDTGTSVYIGVKQGISVKKNEVSAEEGGSVTVQCHYSEKHREDEKKWCRSGNVKSCMATKNGTFISKSLFISDDRKDTVNVTMRQLEIRDAGWYWCGAGEHQVSVHVSVTPRSTTTAVLDVKPQLNLTEDSEEAQNFSGYMQYFLVVFGALLFIMIAILLTRKIMREHNLSLFSKEPKTLYNQDIILV